MQAGFALQSAGATDVGSVRRINEDAWLGRPDIGLWAVADGMGGHQAGDVASREVIDRLTDVGIASDASDLLAAVRCAIAEANRALRAEAARRDAGTVIGTTVVALMAHGGHFACLWAGDSRLYRWREGGLVQLSHDHSHVQDMVDAGVLTAQEAERHPMANVITRAVGTQDSVALDQISDALAPGDIFLVCTDGLSKMVPEPEIAAILGKNAIADQPAALIEAAIAHGGADNVTAVVVGVCGARS
jgi:protein phosphatase/serine/threonine-protein phosphatase Stp1